MTALRASAFLALLWLLALAAEDRDVQRIQDRFLAPCCWAERVAVHNSPAASEMRAEVGRMVADGKSEEEIVNIYVARYGERILREPRGYKLIVSMLVPLVLFLVAGVALFAYIRRQRQVSAPASDAD